MALFNDVVRLSFSVFCLLQSTSREKRRANNRVYSLTPITHIHADLINLKFIQSLDGQIRKDQEDWRRVLWWVERERKREKAFLRA